MNLTLWAKSYSAAVNGSGIDLDIDLHLDDLQSLFNQFDPDDIVKYVGHTALLDAIDQQTVEKHFDLCPMETFNEMENRAIAAEEKLASLSDNTKTYTDFEEI
jgi:hypothetical protein